MTYIRIHWRDLLAYQSLGWRLAGARVGHHSYFGPLMKRGDK